MVLATLHGMGSVIDDLQRWSRNEGTRGWDKVNEDSTGE